MSRVGQNRTRTPYIHHQFSASAVVFFLCLGVMTKPTANCSIERMYGGIPAKSTVYTPYVHMYV